MIRIQNRGFHLLLALCALELLSHSACATAQHSSAFEKATVLETAEYIPCYGNCPAHIDTVSAVCIQAYDQILLGEGKSYLHEKKFSNVDDLAGKQLMIRVSWRNIRVRVPDGPTLKLLRGSRYERFRNDGCIRAVHGPILAAARAARLPAKVPSDAFALAGSGKDDLYLWFECKRNEREATIACKRWYKNGDLFGMDWYCARTVDGAPVASDYLLDPLLSQNGRLALTTGAFLQHDSRGRTNGVLDRPGEACR
jgi:hypothetical protein